LLSYIKYIFESKTKYRITSPYVRSFIEQVLEETRSNEAFEALKRVITELGAGSRTNKSNIRKISDVAAKAGCTPEKGRLLFHLIRFTKPNSIIEMGTSLGLSTLYQYFAAENVPFYTLEGCPSTQAFAKKQFQKYAPKAAFQTILGNFDDTLPALLNELEQVDYVLIDGNHRKAPTIDYFEQLAAKAHDNTVLVFDDIHWSPEMEAAWHHIIADQRVTLSLDVLHYGIVFFRKEQLKKEHFALVPSKYKFWQKLFPLS
jgi:predicted O-methyltransferase YrrM